LFEWHDHDLGQHRELARRRLHGRLCLVKMLRLYREFDYYGIDVHACSEPDWFPEGLSHALLEPVCSCRGDHLIFSEYYVGVSKDHEPEVLLADQSHLLARSYPCGF